MFVFMTKKKYEVELAEAYAEGFEEGIEIGREEMAFERLTPNEIRAAVGLPPIDGCGKEIKND